MCVVFTCSLLLIALDAPKNFKTNNLPYKGKIGIFIFVLFGGS